MIPDTSDASVLLNGAMAKTRSSRTTLRISDREKQKHTQRPIFLTDTSLDLSQILHFSNFARIHLSI